MNQKNETNLLIKPQTKLKRGGLIVFLVLINMFVPLSIDMYLPAVPTMTEYFNTTPTLVNFTLVGFFFFFAVGILVFGPLSDKYGRKPILVVGVALYVVFSACCAVSATIFQLILFRILQALGAGSMSAVSTALIKDCFAGSFRDRVLAIVQAMAVIGPMTAPLIGALILQFFSWHATFWALAIIGVICFVLSLLFEETLSKEERLEGKLWHTLGRLLVVAKNKGFSLYLLSVSFLAAPYMAYVAICSYIYIDYFQMSQQLYSYFFAFNSAVAVLGPIIYIKTLGIIRTRQLSWAILWICLASGVLLLTFGKLSPWFFLMTFLPFTLAESAVRPLSTGILLDQQDGDTGSASSLINFTQTAAGSLGMVVGALPWGSFITGLGIIIVVFVAFAILLWIYVLKSSVQIKHLK